MLTKPVLELSISDLFRGDLQLTSPPNIYLELQKTLASPTYSLADVAFIIEKDAALSLRVLKIVNSAFYGFPSQISSIDRAISLIGSKELQNIVLSTVVIDRFSNLPGNLMSMHDFWAQNLRCALLSQEIDHYLNKEFSESAFICGILHHIGKLVLYRRLPDLAREVEIMLQAKESLSSDVEADLETQIIGFNHYQVGAELTQCWKLPAVISESIRLHPFPDSSSKFFKIAAIVRLANCYSRMENNCSSLVINSLEIPDSIMSSFIDNTDEKFEEIFKVFYPA